VTSPGERVQTVVTDAGILRRRDGELRRAAVGAGATALRDRARAAAARCGWDVPIERAIVELEPPTAAEVDALRRYDPRGLFLRG
jgi:hypothetical protein